MSKTWVRSVRRASDVVEAQVKLLAKKTLNDVIPEKNLKDKAIKEVVSETDIISASSTQEIIRQNKCQMGF